MKHDGVLIFEPDVKTCEVIQAGLQARGYSVYAATHIEQAVILIEQLVEQDCLPDVFILANSCLDDTYTLHEAQLDPANKVLYPFWKRFCIPVIFLCPKPPESNQLVDLVMGGIQGVQIVTKPFDNEELMIRVDQIVARKQEMPDLIAKINTRIRGKRQP